MNDEVIYYEDNTEFKVGDKKASKLLNGKEYPAGTLFLHCEVFVDKVAVSMELEWKPVRGESYTLTWEGEKMPYIRDTLQNAIALIRGNPMPDVVRDHLTAITEKAVERAYTKMYRSAPSDKFTVSSRQRKI